MNFRWIACTVCFSLAGIGAEAATIPLNPSKDNTLIQQSDPNAQLSNGLGDIFVSRTNQDGQGPATISIRRGLIHFDVAGSLPAGATITSVTLTMRDVMGLNGDPVVELRRALKDWGEGTSFQSGGMGAAATEGDATWLYTFYNSGNPTSSPTWTNPGGDFSDTVSAAATIFDDLGGGQFFSWTSASHPQMLVDVQDWLANPKGNFGWLLLGDESRGQSAKRLNGLGSEYPPVLSITYVVPEPSGLILSLVSFLVLAGKGLPSRDRMESACFGE